MGSLDTCLDLRSCGSAGVLAFELASTNSEPVSSWLADTGGVRGFGMSTSPRELAGSSERSYVKWEKLRVSFRSSPSAVNMLWFLLVTVNGTGWYGVESFPSFGCFTSTVSPTCMSESLLGLLLSARLFILSFWHASHLRISVGLKFVSHGTTIGQGSFIMIGLPNRAVAGATPVVQWGVHQ